MILLPNKVHLHWVGFDNFVFPGENTLWNSLPDNICVSTSLVTFKNTLKVFNWIMNAHGSLQWWSTLNFGVNLYILYLIYLSHFLMYFLPANSKLNKSFWFDWFAMLKRREPTGPRTTNSMCNPGAVLSPLLSICTSSLTSGQIKFSGHLASQKQTGPINRVV